MAESIDAVSSGSGEEITDIILSKQSCPFVETRIRPESPLKEQNQLVDRDSIVVVTIPLSPYHNSTSGNASHINCCPNVRKANDLQRTQKFPSADNLRNLYEKVSVLNIKLAARFACYQQSNPSPYQRRPAAIEWPERVPRVAEQLASPETEALQKQVSVLQSLIQELSLQGDLNNQYITERIRSSEVLRSVNWSSTQASKAESKSAMSPSYSRRKRRSVQRYGNKITDQTSEKQVTDFKNYVHSIVSEVVGTNTENLPEKYLLTGEINDENLEEYAQGLVRSGLGRIMEKEIRINRKQNRQSFISISDDRDTTERDGMITLPVARRHAFDGDLVRAFVLNAPKNLKSIEPTNQEENEEYQEETDDTHDTGDLDITTPLAENCPKAFVIKIIKETGNRNSVVGVVNLKKKVSIEVDTDLIQHYPFKPIDTKLPIMYLNCKEGDETFKRLHPRRSEELIYTARVDKICASGFCIIKVKEFIGETGNLQAESYAVICKNNLGDIFTSRFDDRFNDMFKPPALLNNKPNAGHDRQVRLDLTNKCIFTIDPLTARDLDDALSCEQLPNGLYEIGVHISDVSYNLPELSDLDEIVKFRANSLYLIDRVIHMLPQTLCELCSLLPGQQKHAFSAIFLINDNGDVVDTRFQRSCIRSCAQFAYEHAQKIIDSPNTLVKREELPRIYNGFGVKDITQRILTLHKIAMILRKMRFDGGALKINNPKLRFECEPNTGLPIAFQVETQTEANYMIEEFMLLANQAAAKLIYDRFPSIAILRNHPPPLGRTMQALCDRLSKLNFNFEWSSSKNLYGSILQIINAAEDPQAMDAFLTALVIKPMARANYLCAHGKEKADFWHYGLAVPMYTHFTSPIRRYPDILVHRLLAAAMDYCEPPRRSIEELHCITETCNDQKKNAKNNNDDLSKLYFKHFVKHQENGVLLKGVVTDLLKYSVNLIMVETGYPIAVRYNTQRFKIITKNLPDHILIYGDESSPPKELRIASSIDIRVFSRENSLRASFVLPGFDSLPPQRENRGSSEQEDYAPPRTEPAQRSDVPKRNTHGVSQRAQQQRQQASQPQTSRQQQQHRQHVTQASHFPAQPQRTAVTPQLQPKEASTSTRHREKPRNHSQNAAAVAQQRSALQSIVQGRLRTRQSAPHGQRQNSHNAEEQQYGQARRA